mmetsp:Transcript_48266/g.110859  ORF Transcript_48266/g.110859 Transcript_48266/m.110859 type:complete len:217 (+) Transcript_48266:1240-1890(+)
MRSCRQSMRPPPLTAYSCTMRSMLASERAKQDAMKSSGLAEMRNSTCPGKARSSQCTIRQRQELRGKHTCVLLGQKSWPATREQRLYGSRASSSAHDGGALPPTSVRLTHLCTDVSGGLVPSAPVHVSHSCVAPEPRVTDSPRKYTVTDSPRSSFAKKASSRLRPAPSARSHADSLALSGGVSRGVIPGRQRSAHSLPAPIVPAACSAGSAPACSG